MKYARITFWCIIGVGLVAFFYVWNLWRAGRVSDGTGRIIFGSALVPAFVFFTTMSVYCLLRGFSKNEIILMGRYSAASFSRSDHPFRYWLAIIYHLTICILSIYAATVITAEIIK